jgi:two-component system sensor histidine kinase NblS
MLKIQKLKNNYNLLTKALILLDPNCIILYLNEIGVKILTTKKKDLIGTNILLHLPIKIRSSILPIIKYVKKNKRQKISYLYNSDSLINNQDYPKFKLILKPIYIDKTDTLKKIQLNIIPIQNKKKSFFLNSQRISDLSHELRAPLFNIKSFLETLYEYNDQLNSNERLEFLEIATNETNRISKLVKDILDFAELEKSKEAQISKSPIKNIIKEIIQFNKLTFFNKKFILLERSENFNTIVCDYYTLITLLSNILNNAIKFTYPKGIISIQDKLIYSSFLKRDQINFFLRISIIDTGIGITHKDKIHIFDRFSRANTKQNTIMGSGLGLSIVKETLAKKKQKLNLSTNICRGSSMSFNFTTFK